MLLTKQKNKLTLILAIALLFCTILLIFPTEVEAGKADWQKCPICGGSTKHDMNLLGGIQKGLYDMSCIIYGGTSVSNGLLDVLRFDTDSPTFNDLWNNTARDFYDILAKFGELLVIVYMLIALMGESIDDILTPEHFFKHMVKTILGVLVIRIGFDVVDATVGLSTYVFSVFQNGVANAGADSSMCPYDDVVDMNFLDAFGDIFDLVVPWVVMGVATVILNVVCWARILDIITRVIFAPIGMADLFVDGTRSNGLKYIKKLLSSALQGTVLFGVLKGYGVIVASLKSTNNLSIVIMITISYAMISLLFKAQPIADDLVGL